MKKGFTLIELMIVVAIIAIIAAIAIPNLMQSKLQANESAAIAGLKTINTEQTKFKTGNHSVRSAGIGMDSVTTYGAGNTQWYAHNLLNLWGTEVETENAGTFKKLNLISEALAKATTANTSYKGYVFGLLSADKNSFETIATPAVYSKTGIKTFYLNEEGTVYSCDLGATDWATVLAACETVDPTNTDGTVVGTVDGTVGNPGGGVSLTAVADWPGVDATGWVVE